MGSTDEIGSVLTVAAAIAGADAGIVRPTYVVADGEDGPSEELGEHVEREITRLTLDAELEVRHDRSVTDGLLHTADSHRASLIVVPAADAVVAPRPPRCRPARSRRRLTVSRSRSCGSAGSARRGSCWRCPAARPSGRAAPDCSPRWSPCGSGRAATSSWSSPPTTPRRPRGDPRRGDRITTAQPQMWLDERDGRRTSSSSPAVATARCRRHVSRAGGVDRCHGRGGGRPGVGHDERPRRRGPRRRHHTRRGRRTLTPASSSTTHAVATPTAAPPATSTRRWTPWTTRARPTTEATA